MSYTINDDLSIRLTRGDSLPLPIRLLDTEGDTYLLVDDDTLTFTLRKSTNKAKDSVLKDIELTKETTPREVDGVQTYVFYIAPEDTEELEYGEYWYDIVFNDHAAVEPNVFTIPGTPARFEITDEVT